MSKRKTKEEFINDARKKHGDKYDYSFIFSIKNNKTKVQIKCNTCGNVFYQRLHDHLSGCGCPFCAKNQKKETEQFIKEAASIHKNTYDYSKTKYKNNKEKVTIICPKHGEFQQTPHNHLNGQGCPKCKGENVSKRCKWTTERFIEEAKKIHGNKYDYSKAIYTKSREKIEIICKKHGSFFQIAHDHINGCGCPFCRESKLENEIENLLMANGIIFEREKTFSWLKNKSNLKVDFFLPEYNAVIECQGIQHFEPVDFSNNKNKNANDSFMDICLRDRLKKDYCEKNGIKIYYYTNIHKKYFCKVYRNKEKLLNDIIWTTKKES